VARPKPRFRLYRDFSQPTNGTWLVWDHAEKLPLFDSRYQHIKLPLRFYGRADARKAAKEAKNAAS
jgi:hypothetical protein